MITSFNSFKITIYPIQRGSAAAAHDGAEHAAYDSRCMSDYDNYGIRMELSLNIILCYNNGKTHLL